MKHWDAFLCTLMASSEAAQPFGKMVAAAAAAALLVWLLIRQRRRECYLVDFSCYNPPAERRVNPETAIYLNLKREPIIAEHSRFQWKLLLRSGLGEETSLPRFLFSDEMAATMEEARVEMEEAFFTTADELFAKTEVKPQEIDIMIVTVSTFTAAPSHAAVIANHYKMKESVKTYNISGMGCSAGILAVNMARDLLLVNPNSYVLIISSENLTVNSCYPGNDKTFMLADCLFRIGAAAVLLSNKPGDAGRAKLRLVHTVRTNLSADDDAYGCIFVTEDDDGVYGVQLLQSLIDVAGRAIQRNLSTLGRKVLPLHEQLRYAANWVWMKMAADAEPYVPDFKKAAEHVCIHPGGQAVINGVGKRLRLSEHDLEPSRMALYRFGNTSTSGVWYEVAYMQAKRRLKKGEHVLQIALGSGFKCNTAFWEVLQPPSDKSEINCWDDCIHRFPCHTKLDYTNDFCDRWLSRPPPSTTTGPT